MQRFAKFKEFDLRDALVLLAILALISGLALLSIAAALIIPSMGILILGYIRKWY